MEWISVKDQMPTDGDSVLVSCEHGVKEATYELVNGKDKWYVGLTLDEYFVEFGAQQITHWMPLPPAPVTP